MCEGSIDGGVVCMQGQRPCLASRASLANPRWQLQLFGPYCEMGLNYSLWEAGTRIFRHHYCLCYEIERGWGGIINFPFIQE
jgi:hypothetical protein